MIREEIFHGTATFILSIILTVIAIHFLNMNMNWWIIIPVQFIISYGFRVPFIILINKRTKGGIDGLERKESSRTKSHD